MFITFEINSGLTTCDRCRYRNRKHHRCILFNKSLAVMNPKKVKECLEAREEYMEMLMAGW